MTSHSDIARPEDESKWLSLKDSPPDRTPHPRIIVTNNVLERDAHGHTSHIWMVYMVHKQKDGSFSAFDDHDMKIHGLTHWRKAIPEEWK
jgi:hypothetical protein